GVTPFAEGRDRHLIATEIDNYNSINKKVAEKYNIHYIDITEWTRESAEDLSLLTDDRLHPSHKEYYRWAKKIATFFSSTLS
ncbi:MAG: GDSL-type esterase/lipase family protein, partial [Chitinophagaceae bacterium]